MESFVQDIKFGLRMFLKKPLFTSLAVFVLALGIGAATAIFTVINAVLINPLPFSDSEKLVEVSAFTEENSTFPSSYPNFVDWRSQNQVFERMAAYNTQNVFLGGSAEITRVKGSSVSPDLFPLLGVNAHLGRIFTEEDDKPNGGSNGYSVIISYNLWQTRFGASPDIIGQNVKIDTKTFTVIGVMPKGFYFPISFTPVELWMTHAIDKEPQGEDPSVASQRGNHYVGVIAKLKEGVTVEQAQQVMVSLASSLEKQYPDTNTKQSVRVTSYITFLAGDVRTNLLILFAAVGLLLLIACSNVANLLLAQATTRHRETAVRVALGASRLRVIRQFLTESILLSSIGGAFGVLFAMWGRDLLISFSFQEIARSNEATIDIKVLTFTFLISILTGAVFGLVPALQSAKSDLSEALKEGSKGSSDGSSRSRIRDTLVVAEIALAVILLVGAGLLVKSFLNLQSVKLGFNINNMLAIKLALVTNKYSDSSKILNLYEQIRERIKNQPGIRNVTNTTALPLTEGRIVTALEIESHPLPKGEYHLTQLRAVSPEFFKTVGIQLLSGRNFNQYDTEKSKPVVIINETLARKHFPGEDPIGKITWPASSAGGYPPKREIIGVVSDIRNNGLNQEIMAEVYLPHSQFALDGMLLLVSTYDNPMATLPAIKAVLKEIDPEIVPYNIRTLDKGLSIELAQPKFNTMLISVFAALALILTTIGLYGSISYSVVQRTHEIGIRIALGANSSSVLRMIVGQGLKLAVLGVGLGLAGAIAVTRLISSMLFNTSTTDPVTFTVISLLIIFTAGLASYFPAYRATKVDPMIAIRNQ